MLTTSRPPMAKVPQRGRFIARHQLGFSAAGSACVRLRQLRRPARVGEVTGYRCNDAGDVQRRVNLARCTSHKADCEPIPEASGRTSASLIESSELACSVALR